MEQSSCIQKGQIRQKAYPAGFKSALPHLQQLFNSLEKNKVKTAGWNSSSETHNTGKNHNNTDTLSIGTEVPNFAHSQCLDQVQAKWEYCMHEPAVSGLSSAPTRVVALCSLGTVMLSKVQAPSCKLQMLFTFTSFQSKGASQFNQKIFSSQLFDFFLIQFF